jgi:hypothetical protein
MNRRPSSEQAVDHELVFPSEVAEQLWRQHWCQTCFQPEEAARRLFDRGEGCPILALALSGTTPLEFKRDGRRRSRNVVEAKKLFRCTEYRDRPPMIRRPRAAASGTQESLFGELQPVDRLLVPVDGWPDYRAIERNTTKPPGAA